MCEYTGVVSVVVNDQSHTQHVVRLALYTPVVFVVDVCGLASTSRHHDRDALSFASVGTRHPARCPRNPVYDWAMTSHGRHRHHRRRSRPDRNMTTGMLM